MIFNPFNTVRYYNINTLSGQKIIFGKLKDATGEFFICTDCQQRVEAHELLEHCCVHGNKGCGVVKKNFFKKPDLKFTLPMEI